jgi:hypothetical protein
VTASIDYSSFTVTIKRLGTSSKQLQKELVKTLHDQAPGVEASIKGAAFTSIQRHAASTVNVTKGSQGIVIKGGGGGGLGGILFAGAEFGGRKQKKVYRSTRSPAGKAYVVKRRTTMQFLPHLGQEGYFYWPTVRAWLPKLYQMQKATVERTIGGRR